ncbi:MAG: M23 family metallopeptidase [Gemmatimonadota bacterium]
MDRIASLGAALGLIVAWPLIAQPVAIAVHPARPLIERSSCCQFLNFDFVLTNPGEEPSELFEIRVTGLDQVGGVLFTRRLHGQAVMPGILTIPKRIVPAKGEIPILNPFHTLDGSLRIARLDYLFQLRRGDRVDSVAVQVEPKEYRTKTRLVIPVVGRVLVWDGHEFYAHHRRLDITRFKDTEMKQFDRYAYDLTLVDERGEVRKQGDSGPTTVFGWQAPIVAPGDGMVIDAEQDVADQLPGMPPFDEAAVGTDYRKLLGNFVIIDHQNGEYSVMCHMRQRSLTVKKGDRVRAGQRIGKIGNSPGGATVAHLHYQLQDGPDPFVSEGLPSSFTGFYRLLGGKRVPVTRGQIDTGDIVEGR